MRLSSSRFLLLCVTVAWAAILASGTASAQSGDMLLSKDAINHVGEIAEVCGLIAGARYARKTRGDPTYLNFGKPFPDQEFSAIVWGADRRKFDIKPESLEGYKACVYGKITLYQGKPQIVLKKAEQLNYAPPKKSAGQP